MFFQKCCLATQSFIRKLKPFRVFGLSLQQTILSFFRTQKDIDAYGERKGMFAKPNPPENTFPVSMIPWTSFEGFNLNLKKGYDYLLPIFTFGKYYEEGGKYYIPLSIQVHHAVCDGFHVCRFLDELQDLLNK